jgi:putative transposase
MNRRDTEGAKVIMRPSVQRCEQVFATMRWELSVMTSHHYTESAAPDATKRYASDLSDQEFALIAPHVAQKDGSGKKRTVDIREVLNAIFYRTRTGCQWRMLPSDFPAWYHVWYYYRKWRNDGTLERINAVLRREVRSKAGREPEPSVAIIDSQSVETTEMGGEKGFDPAKQVKGRKRHLMTDTLGLILFLVVCAACCLRKAPPSSTDN